MKRNKKIIVTSHCVLNQNAVVAELARSNGVMTSVIEWSHEQGYGIIQLPCPEFTFLGPERPPMTVEQYDTPEFHAHNRKILAPVIEQLQVYQNHGYTIVGGWALQGALPAIRVKAYLCRTCSIWLTKQMSILISFGKFLTR